MSSSNFRFESVVPRFYPARNEEAANLRASGGFCLFFVGALVYFVVGPGVGGGERRNVIPRNDLFGISGN